MLAWAAILVFGFIIIKLILSASVEKKAQALKLRSIQRQIAENESRKDQRTKNKE